MGLSPKPKLRNNPPVAAKRRTWILGGASGLAVAGVAMWWPSSPKPEVLHGEELVGALLSANREHVLQVSVAALLGGATTAELLEAAYVLPVVSGRDDGDVHAQLVIPAVLGGWSENLISVLWAVDNAHLWSGQEAVPRSLPRQWNGHDSAQAWAREMRFRSTEKIADPHLPIHAAQASRAVFDLGFRKPERILHSLERHLSRATGAVIEVPEGGPVASFESSRSLAEHLRGSLVQSVSGLPTRLVWDALARLALDLRLSDVEEGSGPPVHHTTLLDALMYIHEQEPDPDRREVIRQRSASWIASQVGDAPANDSARAPVGDETDPLAWAAFGRALGEAEQDASAFSQSLRAGVAQAATNAHDFKFQSATERIAECLDGEMAIRMRASAAVAPVLRHERVWERRAEAIDLLNDSGVGH